MARAAFDSSRQGSKGVGWPFRLTVTLGQSQAQHRVEQSWSMEAGWRRALHKIAIERVLVGFDGPIIK